MKVVFKWIMRGFSGHLPPEQLLYLWDLILGYDSLEIIPLLAVTILSFRKENLMQVNNQQSVEVKENIILLSNYEFVVYNYIFLGDLSRFVFFKGYSTVAIGFAKRVM